MVSINTALGPIDSEKLGFTQSHEHISGGFGGSPQHLLEQLKISPRQKWRGCKRSWM